MSSSIFLSNSNDNKEIINEIKLLPYKLQVIGKMYDTEIYGSTKIDNVAKDEIKKNIKDNNLIQPIFDLIDKKVIMIGYIEKGIFNFYKRKAVNHFIPPVYDSLAYFSNVSNNILICLDNNTSFFGEKLQFEDFYKITIHELMHMSAHNYPKDFLNTNKEILIKFYDYFLNNVFKNFVELDKSWKGDVQNLLDEEITKDLYYNDKDLLLRKEIHREIVRLSKTTFKKNDIEDLLIRLVMNEKAELKNDNLVNKFFGEIVDIWTDFFMKYEMKKQLARQLSIMMIIYYTRYYLNYSINNNTSWYFEYFFRIMQDTILDAYHGKFKYSVRTFAYQELTYPSEIICILSENKLDAKNSKLLEKIAKKN
jgi:hypothetical protein